MNPEPGPNPLLAVLNATPQSGEALGQQLGVGRVTINTWARNLQAQGVPVQITRVGYSLPAGTPAPGMVVVQGELGRHLRYFGTVGSTQDELRRWANGENDAEAPAPHGAVVVAERQTVGRGRRGRNWDTLGGSLAFSLLLRGEATDLSLARLPLLPLAVGVALQATCAGLGVPCGLKWPNDLLSPECRKLAGILLEADLRGEEARQAIVGIGINVTSAPPGAASLSELYKGQPELTRAAVLERLLPQLEHWLTQNAAQILRAWREHNLTLGQTVQVAPTGPGQPPVTGVAQDIDEQGNLLILTAAGKIVTIHAGDVQLIGQLPDSWAGPAP